LAKDSKRPCPVCDSEVPQGKDRCPVCKADLNLFEEGIDLDEEVSEESIEKVMGLVLDEEDEEELIGDLEELGLSEEDILEESEDESFFTFECPICESEVSDDASKCPECGVVFEAEEEEDEVEIDEVEEEDSIESFEKRIGKLDRFGIGLEEIKEDLEEVKKTDELDPERENTLMERLKITISHAEEIKERLERCKNYLEWISQKTDASEIEGWLDQVYRGCEIGEYAIAAKKAKEVERDVEEVVEDMGLTKKHEFSKVMKEKKKSIQEILSELEKKIIKTHRIKKMLKKAEKEKKKNRILASYHSLMSAQKMSESLYDVAEDAAEAKSHLEKLSLKGVDTSEYSNKIDEAMDKAEHGDFTEAKDLLDENIAEMKKTLEKKLVFKDQDKKDHFKKIQQKIPEMTALLKTAKNFDVDVKDGKELINQAVKKTKDNEYEDALNSLNECKIFFQKKLENQINEKIKNIERRLPQKERGTIIEDIKKYRDQEDYEKVSESIEKAKEKIEEKRKEKAEDKKEVMEEVKKDIAVLEGIIKDVKEHGFKFPEAEKLLKKAKERSKQKNPQISRKFLLQAEDKLSDELPAILRDEIKGAKNKLKEAKIKGADVSKPVKYLKETNKALKRGDVKKSFENLKKYKKSMDEING